MAARWSVATPMVELMRQASMPPKRKNPNTSSPSTTPSPTVAALRLSARTAITNEFRVPDSTEMMNSGPGRSCSPGLPMSAIHRLPKTFGMNHTNPMTSNAMFPTMTPTQFTLKVSAMRAFPP